MVGKGYERLCVIGESETEQRLQHFAPPPVPLAIAVRLFRSPGLLNRGPGAQPLCWELVPTARSGALTSSSELQLPDFLFHPGLYHCSTATQFNLSTVKPPANLLDRMHLPPTQAHFSPDTWPGWRSICNISTVFDSWRVLPTAVIVLRINNFVFLILL